MEPVIALVPSPTWCCQSWKYFWWGWGPQVSSRCFQRRIMWEVQGNSCNSDLLGSTGHLTVSSFVYLGFMFSAPVPMFSFSCISLMLSIYYLEWHPCFLLIWIFYYLYMYIWIFWFIVMYELCLLLYAILSKHISTFYFIKTFQHIYIYIYIHQIKNIHFSLNFLLWLVDIFPIRIHSQPLSLLMSLSLTSIFLYIESLPSTYSISLYYCILCSL